MTVYYNEIDKYAADWLRNLIAAGHIADGIVDERSIVDVYPSDLEGFTQCHFFAGVGVWSHALRSAGWPDDRPVWTGSCPCQPFSDAGSGLGTSDPRHLWPHWVHLIRKRRPCRIYGEQVASRDALGWWDHVHADLEDANYACGAFDLCAAGVGAPHIRQRLYWLADDNGHRREQVAIARLHDEKHHAQSRRKLGYAERNGSGRHARAVPGAQGEAGWGVRGLTDGFEPAGAARGADWGVALGDAPVERPQGRAVGGERPDAQRAAAERAGAARGAGVALGDTERDGLRGGRRPAADQPDESGDGSLCGLADADEFAGRQGRPVDGGGNSRSDAGTRPGSGGGVLPCFWDAADWIDCRDGKRRPVEPGTFPLAHGASARVGRLRAYGNAIVAPLAAEFVRCTL